MLEKNCKDHFALDRRHLLWHLYTCLDLGHLKMVEPLEHKNIYELPQGRAYPSPFYGQWVIEELRKSEGGA